MAKTSLKEKAKALRAKTTQVFLALKSKQTPWYAKAVGALAIAYALSPIDLIPDFIPVLGYLDDLLVLPLFLGLTIKLIPKDVFDSYEEQAKAVWADGAPKRWYFAIPIILLWLLVIYLIVKAIFF